MSKYIISCLLLVLIPIAVITFVAGTCSILSFVFAITPEEAIERGDSIPADWEAGVFNHGEYYRWYTIEKHPVLFIFSAMMVIGSSIFVGIVGLVIRAVLFPYLRNTVFADFLR